MKNICNNCGHTVPDGAKQCPNCGAPLANASTEEKKLWERTDLNRPATSAEPQVTPPPYKPLRKRRFRLAAILAAVAVAIILLFLAILLIKGTKSHVQVSHQTTRVETQQSPDGNATTTVVTSGNLSDAQMQQMMQEMAQMDSMMNAMMGGDPFAELEQMMGDDPTAPVSAQPSRPARQATDGVAKMAGRIGNREYLLVFNYKDPQNVKGSGTQVENGKTTGRVHVLGILDGSTLTMSIYPQGAKTPIGTISGQFDGSTLQGTYISNDAKAQETQVIFYEE